VELLKSLGRQSPTVIILAPPDPAGILERVEQETNVFGAAIEKCAVELLMDLDSVSEVLARALEMPQDQRQLVNDRSLVPPGSTLPVLTVDCGEFASLGPLTGEGR
jgi:hypothetical protein